MLPKRSHSLSAASSAGPAAMEGVLEKKKTFGSSKYYCALRDGKLWYGEDKSRESLIDISHAQSIREGKAKFSFEIITSSRTHTFTADSQASRDKWITSLREAMRLSSRKNSTLSFIENTNSDEEDGGSAAAVTAASSSRSSRSSLSSESTASSSIKSGFSASLPAEHVKRSTPLKPFPTEGQPRASPTTDSLRKQPSQLKPISEPVLVEETTTLEKEHETIEGNTCHAPLKVDEGNTVDGDFGKIRSVSTSLGYDNDDRTGDSSVKTSADVEDVRSRNEVCDDEIVTLSPSSLYANNADLKKFLSKQSMENERVESVSEEMEGTEQPGAQTRDSTNEEERKSPSELEFTEKDSKADEDSVFPMVSETIDPLPKPSILRRPSQPSVRESFQVVVVPPETTEVQLEVDFHQEPIVDLPHPRLESTWSAAFADIRAFLLDNSKTKDEGLVMTPVFREQPGCAVESLKHFLQTIERG